MGRGKALGYAARKQGIYLPFWPRGQMGVFSKLLLQVMSGLKSDLCLLLHVPPTRGSTHKPHQCPCLQKYVGSRVFLP